MKLSNNQIMVLLAIAAVLILFWDKIKGWLNKGKATTPETAKRQEAEAKRVKATGEKPTTPEAALDWNKNLYKGIKAKTEVKKLQEMLNYDINLVLGAGVQNTGLEPLAVDGSFGAATEKALKYTKNVKAISLSGYLHSPYKFL